MEFSFEDTIFKTDQDLEKQRKENNFRSTSVAKDKGFQSRVCEYYLSGTCMKGLDCTFLHQFDLTRMSDCQLGSNCTEEGCLKNHPKISLLCTGYAAGFCKLGNRCPMEHKKIDRVPELVDDDFLKTILGENARFPKLSDDLKNRLQSFQVPFLDIAPQESLGVLILRPNNMSVLQTASTTNVWVCNARLVDRLREFHETKDHVIFLIFAFGSGGFQGYAKMTSAPYKQGNSEWVVGIKWLVRCQTVGDFQIIQNPLNDNNPIRKSPHGQELPADLGARICQKLATAPEHTWGQSSNLQPQYSAYTSAYTATTHHPYAPQQAMQSYAAQSLQQISADSNSADDW